MRKLSIVALFFSSFVFATNAFVEVGTGGKTFSGNGVWKDLAGATGTYESKLVFGDHKLNATVTVKDKTFNYELVAVAEKNGFFQLTVSDVANATIGGGYCFDSICHYGVKMGENGGVEETFAFDKDTLYVAGSKWGNCNHGKVENQNQQQQEECKMEAVAWKAKLALAK